MPLKITDTRALIETFVNGGGQNKAAYEALVAKGPKILPDLLGYTRDVLVAVDALFPVFCDIADDSVVAALIDLVGSSEWAISNTAVSVLGHLGDPRATAPLLNYLERWYSQLGSLQSQTLEALMHLQNREALPRLRKIFDEWTVKRGGRDLLKTEKEGIALVGLISLCATLASLGERGTHGLAFEIASLSKSALKAWNKSSWFLVGCAPLNAHAAPGLLTACRNAFKGADQGSKQLVQQTLGALGTREVLETFVEMADVRNPQNSESAAYWLDIVAGADLPEAEDGRYGEIAAAWWKKSQGKFPSGVSYRRGKPMHPADLLENLDVEMNKPDQDFFFATGIHLLRERKRRGLSRAQTIAAVKRDIEKKFKAGRFYRFGVEYDPAESSS